MKPWTPQGIYDAKPWAFICIGAGLALGATIWSLAVGSWTIWRSLACFGGAALAIIGGATLQLRQDYRAQSKLRRDPPP